MSIIVKGMEMPENCFECPCCRHDSRNGYQKEQCNLTLDVFDAGYYERFEGRAQNCPLIALPDHHGRLVDADAFKADYGMKDDCADCEKEMRGKVMMCEYDRNYSKMDFCGWIDDAPTIVEAEDGS